MNSNDRIIISFSNKDTEGIRIKSDKFEPVLYNNLFVPSYVHGYSLAIEYMKRWFLSKFEIKKNLKDSIIDSGRINAERDSSYFNYVHINGKHMFDDYKRFNKQNVKREKPLCIITPSIEHDYNRENIDLYNAGAEVFLRRSDYQKSFFKDNDKNLYLGMQMKELKMNFNFRVRVNTRAEQLDLVDKMRLLFRLGGTSREYKTADFVLPQDALLNIANDAGFRIDNNEIVDPVAFLDYLNSHSQIPILYKLRNINNKKEFYMRLNGIHCNIWNTDNLDVDDGERVGMVDTDFNIDMQVSLRMSIPHFFVYFNEKPLEYQLKTDIGGVGLYTLSQFLIEPKNEYNWDTFMNTTYKLDPKESLIDFSEVLENTNLHKVILHELERFRSPESFIQIKVYKELAGEYPEVYSRMNYSTLELEVEPSEQEEYIYIVIYVDKLFLNNTLLELTKMDSNNRIQ